MPALAPSSAPGAAAFDGVIAGAVLLFGIGLAAGLIALGPLVVEALHLTGSGHSGLWNESVFTLAIFGTMLGLALVGGALSGVRAFDLGDRVAARLALGGGLGVAGLAASITLAWLAGTLVAGQGTAVHAGAIALGGVTVLLQVVAEEAYFRGWLQPFAARRWGFRVAVPAVAAGFAALHLLGGVRDPVAVANLFLGGLVFGLLAARARGIAPAIGMHVAWNGAEQLLVGLDPNPGAGSFGAIVDLDLIGAIRWGGSPEGLNASVAMTFALLAILAPLLIHRPAPQVLSKAGS